MRNISLLVVAILVRLAISQLISNSFPFNDSPASTLGLQVDNSGLTYVSAGNTLYRLTPNLELEESITLPVCVVNRGIALSGDHRELVVCLADLSCSVYNASSFADGSFWNVSDAIASAEHGVALFSLGDTFYTGSVTGVTGTRESRDRMVVNQFGKAFTRSSDLNHLPVGDYTYHSYISRQFYGGFLDGGYAYYIVSDFIVQGSNTQQDRAFRILRVCNASDCNGTRSCGVSALYEGSFSCGSDSLSRRARVCGLSLLNGFGEKNGTVAIVTKCESETSRNSICLVNITAVNEMMNKKFESCSSASGSSKSIEETNVVWDDDFRCNLEFEAPMDQPNITKCNIPRVLGLRLSGAVSSTILNTGFNVITASAAVKIDNYTIVYIGLTIQNGTSILAAYDVSKASLQTVHFFSTIVSSTVRSLFWAPGQEFVTAVTGINVFQVPIEQCSSHTDCTSCITDPNPLCGWCVVENKCSRKSQCQNSSLTSTMRWINRNCIKATISPKELIVDTTENFTVTLNWPGLPVSLPGEIFYCHLSNSNGKFPSFVVPAVKITPRIRRAYTCNIQGRIPDYDGVAAEITFSFMSSFQDVPFISIKEALTLYKCSGGRSCRECLQEGNPCGWCNLNKVCSHTSGSCKNESTFLQTSNNTKFEELCPFILNPPSGNYLHSVRVTVDIQLASRNLISPDDGFDYVCQVNGVSLTAQYVNENSILCLVSANDLLLPTGVRFSTLTVIVLWVGEGITYQIDNFEDQTSVTLYECREFPGCSSCLGAMMGSGFMCGWCAGSCEVTSECSNTLVTVGDDCPAPIIQSFHPTSGPVDGGTAIEVRGTDLGVTLPDIQNAAISLGGVPCVLSSTSYIAGQQFVCETTEFAKPGNKYFSFKIGSRQAISDLAFKAVHSSITDISPAFGPVAGGTAVRIKGTNLDIGNQEDTTVFLETVRANFSCIIRSIDAEEVYCVTTAGELGSAQGVIRIDSSRVISPSSVTFDYRSNPSITSVFPRNTIPSGGIILTFSGQDMDVIQKPILETELGDGSTSVNGCTTVNGSIISCVTPNLGAIDSNLLNYSLVLDAVPPTTSALVPIRVLPDPSNFSLATKWSTDLGTIIGISGSNIDSVQPNEIKITIDGEICDTSAMNLVSPGQVFCKVPDSSPNGAEIRVMVGENINIVLKEHFTYSSTIDNTVVTVVPIVITILLVTTITITVIVFLWRKRRQQVKRVLIEMENRRRTTEEESSHTALLQSQINDLSKLLPDSLKIPSSHMSLSSAPIGQGEFGIVYKGCLMNWKETPSQSVAVKTLKGLFSPSDVQSMISEIVKMQDFQHAHVMSLIGVCLDAGPGVSIVMPFMANGNLLDYLKKERSSLEPNDDCEIDEILSVRKLLLRISQQIAMGMAYLAEQKFVHRDLAARNCMLDSSGSVKVCDFGLAEDVYTTGYFRQKNRADIKLPYKWMALESLTDGVYTEKTDVWSYGVTIWEVFNSGRAPYPAMNPLSLIQLLREGKRLERPSNSVCAMEIFAVMRKCWREGFEERPTFKELVSTVGCLLSSIAGYTELTMELYTTLNFNMDEPRYDYVIEKEEIELPTPNMNGTTATDCSLGEEMEITKNSAYLSSDHDPY